ncbi:choline dehydrogenase [Solimonas marina]|uniref:Choline dehydrogenase n=1 Tax=Solimonas marina TaxID=2714601 RepID=A0A969WCP7_9GAMM|nr:choline dehydrogenase [Solimonas marina]
MEKEYDYVVIGGGSAGCVMASRLTETPETSVCLLESGGSGDNVFVNVPVCTVAMMPTKIGNWAFETQPQAGLNGRRGYQPRGKNLGGSSAMNAMVYIRGHQSDYDRWSALGNAGWSYREVLPYFIRNEGNERIRNRWHGNEGPLNVADVCTDNPVHARYLEAARQVGFRITDDFNGADQEGVGIYQVTQKDGRRCSAARAYLFPHLGRRRNLAAFTGAHTQKILFEGRRAIGVSVRLNGVEHVVRARREVIVSAGAFQSPQLLMLSGIGDREELQRHGIPVVHHLPGVGRNLQDHPDFVFGYRSTYRYAMGLSLMGALRMIREFFRFRRAGRGAFSSNFAEGGGFLKTRPELPAPDVQLHFVVALVDDHARKLHLGHGISCHVCLLRPRSTGSVRLRSADAADAPLIDPAFLKDPRDLQDLVEGFKLTRRLMEAPALSGVVGKDLFTAGVKTDQQIADVIRARADSVYHPVGTCKMGIDEMAVVDPQLRVHGCEALRVVDASIMPTLIGGNTNAPAMMIAEKAVDMILGRMPVAAEAPSPVAESCELGAATA